MKANKENIEFIKQRFHSMESKEDLLLLINEVNKIIYGEDAYNLKLRTLNYFANPSLCKKRYTTFNISKKSGGIRTINAPVKSLKYILKALNLIFQSISDDSFKIV